MIAEEAIIRRYFAVVAELSSSEDELVALLDPEVRVIEHPNPISPRGANRGLDETLAGFRAGKALLREQSFDVHEVIVTGERAAVRATWMGVIGMDTPQLPAGSRLTSYVAAFVTVRNGRIVHHETFYCYEPF